MSAYILIVTLTHVSNIKSKISSRHPLKRMYIVTLNLYDDVQAGAVEGEPFDDQPKVGGIVSN